MKRGADKTSPPALGIVTSPEASEASEASAPSRAPSPSSPRQWRRLRLAFLLTALLLSLFGFLRSTTFRRLLFLRLSNWIQQEYHLNLALQSWDFDLLQGRIQVSNLYLSQREGAFFARVKSLEARIPILDVLFGTPSVETCALTGPDLSLDLPSPLYERFKAKRGPVAWRFKGLTVREGRLRLRALEIPLDFDAGTLQFDMGWLPSGKPREARLTIRGGNLAAVRGRFPLEEVALKVVFSGRNTLEGAGRIVSPLFRWEGKGQVALDENLSYTLAGRGGADLARLGDIAPGIPISATGVLTFEAGLRGVRGKAPAVEGTVKTSKVTVGKIGVPDFTGRLSSVDGRIALQGLHLETVSGGRLDGQLLFYPNPGLLRLGGVVDQLGLGQLLKQAGRTGALDGRLTGQIEFDLPLAGNPEFRFDGEARDVSLPLPNSPEPFQGTLVRGRCALGPGFCRFEVDTAQGEGVQVAGAGKYQAGELWLDKLSVAADCGNDVRDLLNRIVRFYPTLKDRIDRTTIRGPISFEGRFHLRGAYPEIHGAFDAADVTLGEIPLGAVKGGLDLSESFVQVTDASFARGANRTDLSFSLRLLPTSRLESVHLQTTGISLRRFDQLTQAFSIRPAAMSQTAHWDGVIRGRLDLVIPEGKPWEGSFDLSSNDLQWENRSFGVVTATGTVAGTRILLDRIALKHERYQVAGNGWWDGETNEIAATVKSDGFPLDEIPQVRSLEITGTLQGAVTVRGQLTHPQTTFDLSSKALTFFNEPFGNLTLKGATEGDAIRFALRTQYRDNLYKADGRIFLGDKPRIECGVNFDRIQIAPFAHQIARLRDFGIQGEATGNVLLSSPLDNLREAALTAKVSAISLQFGTFVVRNAAPFELSLARGALRLNKAGFLFNDAPVTLEGDYPVFREGAMLVHAEGNTPLRVFQPLFTDLRINGQVRFGLTAQGDPQDPNFSGTADIVDGSVRIRTPLVMLDKINGQLEMTQKSIRLKTVEFNSASGRGVLDGDCILQRLKPVQWNIQVRSEHLYPHLVEGFLTDLSVGLRVRGTPEGSIVSGDVWVEKIAPAKDINVVELIGILSTAFSGAAGTGETGEAVRRIKLNVTVHGDRSLAVSSPDLTFNASTELQIKGDVGSPAVRGNIVVNSGELKFGSNRFTVDHGLLLFNRASGLDPDLALQISSEIKDYRVSIILEGNLSKVKARFVSVPSLSSVDIVRLISTGTLPTGSDRSLAEVSQAADTSSLLGQMLSETVSTRLKRVVGIDTLALGAYSADPTTSAKAQVTLGKQVTRDLYVTYTKSTTSEDQDLIYMEYRFTPAITVIGTRDEKGYIGLDFRFKKRFH